MTVKLKVLGYSGFDYDLGNIKKIQSHGVSLGEIERALAAGYVADNLSHAPIVFTADVLDRPTIARVVELNIPVNCGSPQMLQQLGEAHSGHPVWLRINPGRARKYRLWNLRFE